MIARREPRLLPAVSDLTGRSGGSPAGLRTCRGIGTRDNLEREEKAWHAGVDLRAAAGASRYPAAIMQHPASRDSVVRDWMPVVAWTLFICTLIPLARALQWWVAEYFRDLAIRCF